MHKTDKSIDNITTETNESNKTICISEKTLDMMDESMKNLSNGKTGKEVDISKIKERK